MLPQSMSSPAAPFSAGPTGDKRIPPMGGASGIGQPGAFPSMMFPPGMSGMPNMGGMGPMGGMAGPVPGGMGGAMGGVPAMPMGGMGMPGFPMGGMPMSAMSFGMRARFSVKEQEFEKGLFVEDFEETVTGEMLYKHFNNIKPVSIIKFPTGHTRHSKKFAFVYFRTPEDAKEVKLLIDADCDQEEKAIANKVPQAELNKLPKRHRILKKPIRVSFLAVNKTSKLMLKPKQADGPEGYFSSKNLEKEIKRILGPFPDYKLNKIVVPKHPKDEQKNLDYARVFFDLRQHNTIDDIKELLEKDNDFSKHVEVMEFVPPPKYSNMLYINNFLKKGESSKGLELEMKDFFSKLNGAWEIESVYLDDYKKEGDKDSDIRAWGYITFADKQMCKEAHELLKTQKPKFRGNRIFANIKNEVDPRAVVIYKLKSTITQDQLDDFFNRVAANSKKIAPAPVEGEDKPKDTEERKIFDFYSVCIVEPTKFVHNTTKENVEVPRRAIISFVDPVEKPERILELCGEIEALPEYKNYFDSDGIQLGKLQYTAKPFRLMGHLEESSRYQREGAEYSNTHYVKHAFSDKPNKFDRERKNLVDRPERVQNSHIQKNFQQRRAPVKTGYTPIMNMPRLPAKMGGAFPGAHPGMPRPAGMGPRQNIPFTGMMPPSLAPTGMGAPISGSNPMAGSMAGRPPSKPNVPPTGVVGMPMPSNMNPLTQMSFASGMRPPGNPMGMNPMMGNPMMGNPMMNPMGASKTGLPSNPMANPMGNPMMNPMMGKPFPTPSFPAADKKPTGESDK